MVQLVYWSGLDCFTVSAGVCVPPSIKSNYMIFVWREVWDSSSANNNLSGCKLQIMIPSYFWKWFAPSTVYCVKTWMRQAWRAECLLGWVPVGEVTWSVSGLPLCPSSGLVNPVSIWFFSFSFRTVILSDSPCTRFWVVIMGFIAFLKTQFIVHLLIGFVFVVSGLIINFIQLCTLVLWPINKQFYRRVNCRLAYSLWSREYAWRGREGWGWRGAWVLFLFLIIKEIVYVYTQTHERERSAKLEVNSEQFIAAIFSEILGKHTKVKWLIHIVTLSFKRRGK